MKDKIEFPDDVKKLKRAMFEAGFVRTNFEIQSLYNDFSEDRWCAGWIYLTPKMIDEFIRWFKKNI